MVEWCAHRKAVITTRSAIFGTYATYDSRALSSAPNAHYLVRWTFKKSWNFYQTESTRTCDQSAHQRNLHFLLATNIISASSNHVVCWTRRLTIHIDSFLSDSSQHLDWFCTLRRPGHSAARHKALLVTGTDSVFSAPLSSRLDPACSSKRP